MSMTEPDGAMLRVQHVVCGSFCGAILVAYLFSLAAFASDNPLDRFSMDHVVEQAQALSKEKFVGPDARIPAAFSSLSADQWEKIAFRREAMLWKESGIPFSVGFYHSGFIYNHFASFNVVDNGSVSPVPFTADDFDYPTPELKEQAHNADINFAGFYLHPNGEASVAGINVGDADELASFLGRTFFRSRARHSRYGVYARGVAVDTADPNGEEFPYFREFWLVKPELGDTSLSLYALMDSPRITGAFHIIVSLGASTMMEVEARLFERAGVGVPKKIGLAALTSMFLHSETSGGGSGDYRPEVHNSDGLLLSNKDGEWSWCPLSNPTRLAINEFPLESPRGFGLMQRDDNFDHYQDLDQRFERRSSLWVEPVDSWGPGHVELVEIPATADYQGNIVAFWVADPPPPDTPPAKPAVPGELASVKYRLYWMASGATPHNLGRVVSTRMQKNAADNTILFIVDFEGERLNAFDADTGLISIVETPEHFAIAEKSLVKNEATSGWRLWVKVKLPPEKGLLNSLFSAAGVPGPTRFKAFLKLGENLPDPLTETWVFDLQP